MLKVIIYLLLTGITALAETVYFGWGYDEPIANFRIYTGAVPHVGEEVWVIPASARRAGVPVPDNHYAWITAVNDAALESEPSPALQFKPVTVRLVIQQTKDLREWGGSVGVFLFRVPDTIVGQVEQRLNITKTHVEVRAYGQTFRVPIPTGVGKKFFRSFVSLQPS